MKRWWGFRAFLPVLASVGLVSIGWIVFFGWTVGTAEAVCRSDVPPAAPIAGSPAGATSNSDTPSADLEKLQKEIQEAARTGGMDGVRAWAVVNKPRLTAELITSLTEKGTSERNEEWFHLAVALAENCGDEKVLAAVLLAQADYYRKADAHGRAMELYDRVLPLFEKEADALGQGKAWLGKGNIYLVTGENERALEMYEQARLCFEKANYLRGQGSVLLNKGDIYRMTGDGAKALEMYDQALPLLEKASSLAGQGSAYYRKGLIHYLAGDNHRALQFYDQALPFLEKAEDLTGLGDVWKGKGDIYFFLDDNDQALEMYERALYFYERAPSLRGQGDVWKMRGEVYHFTGNRQKAREMYDKALFFYEKAAHPWGQADVLHKMASAYRHAGDNARALEIYDRAMVLFEKTGNPQGQGNVWQGRAAAYAKMGDSARALEMYDRALPFFEKEGEPLGQANVFEGKGDLYVDLGDYGQALEMFEKALTLYEKMENGLGMGSAWLSRGLVYRMTGEYERALEALDKAIPYFEAADHPAGQGYVKHFKGDVYLDRGELQQALQMYDQALPFLVQAQNLLGQGNVLLGKGEIYRLKGDYERALTHYHQALPFYEKESSLMGQGNIWVHQGDTYMDSGDTERALEMYERALPSFLRIGAMDVVASVTISKARALAATGKTAAAANLFETGIEDLERVRRRTRLPDLTRSFTKKVYSNYESAARFLLDHGMGERAFRVVESMKARGFLDRLAEGRTDLAKGILPELKLKRDRLLRNLDTAAKHLTDEASGADAARLEQLREAKRTAENDLALVEEEIRLKNPLFASVQYPASVTARELQQAVLRPGEALVEYFLAEDGCWAFVATRKHFSAIPLKTKKNELEHTAAGFLKALETRQGVAAAGRRLSDGILRPLERKLPAGSTLWIVPDGVLAQVPFEALPADEKKGVPVYLLESRDLRYIQSATVLAFLRAHGGKEPSSRQFTGFGDPVYDYASYLNESPESGELVPRPGESALEEIRRGRWDRAGLPLSRLPGTAMEIEAIDAFFAGSGQGHRKYLRLEAREEVVKGPETEASGYIHFACHGLLGDDYQSLALSRIPGSAEDGFLDIAEIMNLDWNARLVVLSACETGKGKLERGEGVTGLTRAVMYAGTPAVAASLWSVSDEATAELMTRFYRHLVEEKRPPAEALRAAKRELLRGDSARVREATPPARPGQFSHPYFWAAFVLYGE